VGVLDNIAMPLLLAAAVANALAHYRTGMNPESGLMGAPFAMAAAAGLAMVLLLVAVIAWPDSTLRGPIFLLIAVALLSSAVWFWRDKLPRAPRAMD